jgi:hypothetical protein
VVIGSCWWEVCTTYWMNIKPTRRLNCSLLLQPLIQINQVRIRCVRGYQLSDYQDYSLLGHNAMLASISQPTFRTYFSHPISGWKSKPSNTGAMAVTMSALRPAHPCRLGVELCWGSWPVRDVQQDDRHLVTCCCLSEENTGPSYSRGTTVVHICCP